MLSQRIRQMQPSPTVELNARVTELVRQGQEIIMLNVGEPDFDTPEYIKRAAIQAIEAGFTRYTPVNGIYELRAAICQKLKHDNQVNYQPDEIIITVGAKQALTNAILTICEAGDEVIIPTPCWSSFIEMVKLADSTPVLVATNEVDGFQLNLNNIQQALSKRTKAIILNSPHNPTGAVYSKTSLLELGQLALKHDFFIITDEVYEKLVYEDARHYSVAALSPELRERTILVNSFSKAYAMTGWRLGYAAAPPEIVRGMRALQGHIITTTNSIAQKAALAALTGPQVNLAEMRQHFDERRKYLLHRLKQLKPITCADVKGAFYLMPNISALFGKHVNGQPLKNSHDVAHFLLEAAQVAVVPGAAFEAPNHLRISYSNSLENIRQAMDQIKRALNIKGCSNKAMKNSAPQPPSLSREGEVIY